MGPVLGRAGAANRPRSAGCSRIRMDQRTLGRRLLPGPAADTSRQRWTPQFVTLLRLPQ